MNYQYREVDGLQKIFDPKMNYIGYVLTPIEASNLTAHLNAPKGHYTIVNLYGGVNGVNITGYVLCSHNGQQLTSTRHTTLDPKKNPPDIVLLTRFLTHLNR